MNKALVFAVITLLNFQQGKSLAQEVKHSPQVDQYGNSEAVQELINRSPRLKEIYSKSPESTVPTKIRLDKMIEEGSKEHNVHIVENTEWLTHKQAQEINNDYEDWTVNKKSDDSWFSSPLLWIVIVLGGLYCVDLVRQKIL